jgi:nucleotide-binding universal stress UspA family protein
VLTVGEEPRRHPGDDVMALLGRHCIAARRLVRPPSRGTSATILATAAEVGADLLVMGAYEHSKFSEDFLGGVTQDILTGAGLPVLMSH